MSTNTYSLALLARLGALLLIATPFAASQAAPINYGDFVGSTVMYLDVTETANTPGDSEPLYSSPTIVGDILDFNPAGFVASAGGGNTDITDGQLNFMLMGLPSTSISSIQIRESGDYTLFGTGTATTSIYYGASIGSITVWEIDGIALASPIILSAASASGGDNLGGGTDVGTPWSLGLTYDVNAALNFAGISYVNGATKLGIAIDNNLGAISETSTIAMVAKKDFRIDVDTKMFIPVPGALVLMFSGLIGLVGMARVAKRST